MSFNVLLSSQRLKGAQDTERALTCGQESDAEPPGPTAPKPSSSLPSYVPPDTPAAYHAITPAMTGTTDDSDMDFRARILPPALEESIRGNFDTFHVSA